MTSYLARVNWTSLAWNQKCMRTEGNEDTGGKGIALRLLGDAVPSFKPCQLSLTHGDERLIVSLHDILVKFLLPFF